MTARKKVIQGGTSAGKTYAIIPILISLAAATPKMKFTIVAETIPAVKDGAVDIFKEIMVENGRWREDGWKGNPMEYTFANGTRIQFRAFDTVGKAIAAGKRDILFINEANNIEYNIADALMIRSKHTYMDYNPSERFWAHNEVLNEPNAEFLSLTFRDNEGLPPETLEDLLIKKDKAFHLSDLDDSELLHENNIKSPYWFNWWRVYGMGLIGSLEGVIFTNWAMIKELPPEAEFIGHGMDFGFTNDPTTLISLYRYDGKIVIDERIYQRGLLNSQIIDQMRALQIENRQTIFADSAEPKTIREIEKGRFNIKPVEKGPDSIRSGIKLMMDQEFLITEQSTNTIKEFRNYIWAKNRIGELTGKPIDDFNHAIDAIRYCIMMTLGKKKLMNYGGHAD